MSNAEGRFVWYELMTPDPEAARAFYGKVVGWNTRPGIPGTDYTLFTASDVPVAGLLNDPEELRTEGIPPHWLGYVGVANVDIITDQMIGLGGCHYVPPRDIPEVGRFAVLADQQGAAVGVIRWAQSAPARPAPAPGKPGRVGWHELLATDRNAAFATYSALFGWQKGDTVDVEGFGAYQLFTAGGELTGGMFDKPATVRRPFWLYYFTVGDIDAAATRVVEAGGRVFAGPMAVPGGAWIVQATDPQGATFALLGKRD